MNNYDKRKWIWKPSMYSILHGFLIDMHLSGNVLAKFVDEYIKKYYLLIRGGCGLDCEDPWTHKHWSLQLVQESGIKWIDDSLFPHWWMSTRGTSTCQCDPTKPWHMYGFYSLESGNDYFLIKVCYLQPLMII